MMHTILALYDDKGYFHDYYIFLEDAGKCIEFIICTIRECADHGWSGFIYDPYFGRFEVDKSNYMERIN